MALRPGLAAASLDATQDCNDEVVVEAVLDLRSKQGCMV
jgi:hypothetical protein